MNDEKILAGINEEIVRLTPKNFDKIKDKCLCQKIEKGNAVIMKKKNSVYKAVISIAACFAVVVCVLFALSGGKKVDSVIEIDVNPAIEISADKNEKIISVEPLNGDALIVIGDMNFEGIDLDIAVNALIGSMLKNGFITNKQNAVLVSVSNDDSDRQQAILQKVSEDINLALEESEIRGAVLTQSLTHEENVSSLAEQYGISEGKALLIQCIRREDETRSYETLVGLSISELALMLESDSVKSQQNQQTSAETTTKAVALSGEVNKETYIGEEKAKEIAFRDAQITESQVKGLYVSFDLDNGVLVYDVEFNYGGYEYEYEINAVSGNVEGRERDYDDDYSSATTAAGTTAPVTQEQTTKAAQEVTEKETVTQAQQSYIDENKAKAVVLERAGLSEDEVKNLSVKLDNDDGRNVYEISFVSGSYEYDADVDAFTGTITDYDKEYDDDLNRRQTQKATEKTSEKVTEKAAENSSTISHDEAKSVALKHAGVSASDISGYGIELDREGGRAIYEIEFSSGSYDYEYEIDAYTGKVVYHEKEIDD